MNQSKYRRLDLAMNQFEVSVALFLSKRDYISAITLAGAADVIFCQMVNRKGMANFTDYLAEKEGSGRTKKEVGSEVNDLLFINALKHLDPGQDEYVALNAFECALTAILKAMVNYNMLPGKNVQVIHDFLECVRNNLDPKIYNINCDPNWKPGH